MPRPHPTEVKRVACIGAGSIGGAWAAHFLRKGYDVTAWDPAADGEERLRATIDAAWPSLEVLGLSPGADRARLSVTSTLEQALDGADFVQESAPESVPIKVDLLARIDAATQPDVVISSSTSGYNMTDLQVDCAHAERTVVGHPFHPVYMMPLVEVAPGERTDPAVVDWCMQFYDQAGKAAVRCKEGVHGFIANRLQSAIIREAQHMIAAGEASAVDIDRSVSQGPGLRWALMGPILTLHLAGGEGGIKSFFEKFPTEAKEPYSRLASPEITDTLRQEMIDGAEELARGRSATELAAERDKLLLGVLKAVDGGL